VRRRLNVLHVACCRCGAVHKMLMMHLGKDVKFSTQSCYFTEDAELAEKFLEVVQQFNGKGHIYKAVKMQ